MIHKIRRTEINIETIEIKTVRVQNKKNSFYCEHCRDSVTAFTHGQVLAFLRQIETNQIHLIETNDGGSLVCGNTLERNK